MKRDTEALSIDQLENLLQTRRRKLQQLERVRSKIARQLEQVDQKIRQLGGRAGSGGAGSRPRNSESLLESIETVLKDGGKPMKVGDILAGVEKRGYRSTSANFRGIVNQTLIKEKRFAQAGRGLYQLKK
jgi:DNA-binding transcriptional MerR regulator